MRLGVLTSHPIQYQAPLFRELARCPGVDLTVLFCHDHGVRPTLDAEFGRTFRYDVPLLEGYRHRFLHNVAPKPRVAPTGLVNPEVLSSLTSNEFDALVVHGYSHVTSLMALLGPRRRTAVLLRGESHLHTRRPLAVRAFKQMALRALFARLDHFLPIGTWNRQYYAAYGVHERRMTLAPYSVDSAHFAGGAQAPRRDRDATRRRLGLAESMPLFLFCAKLIPKKRPVDAIRALARVLRTERCGLVIVGDGILAPEVQGEIERLGVGHAVTTLGFRNQSELPAIYGACDVLVLPSDDEPWGLVVNEAEACGMAVVVSDRVGAGPDIVDPSRVFPVGDIDAFSKILRRLAASPAELDAARDDAVRRIARWGLAETADGFLRGAELAIRSARGDPRS